MITVPSVIRQATLTNPVAVGHPEKTDGRIRLAGVISGDERFSDGEVVRTSHITHVITANGTMYELK